MVGQWKRGYNGRYVVVDRDDAGIGNGNDVGMAVITDVDEHGKLGGVAILSGDVQFHEYGGLGDL